MLGQVPKVRAGGEDRPENYLCLSSLFLSLCLSPIFFCSSPALFSALQFVPTFHPTIHPSINICLLYLLSIYL